MAKNKKYQNTPFYQRVQQSKDAKFPALMQSQNKQLCEIQPYIEKTNVPDNVRGFWTAGVTGAYGKRGVEISLAISGQKGTSGWLLHEVIDDALAEVKWVTPNQATVLRLQGAVVKEVHS